MALIYEEKVPIAYRAEFIAKVKSISSKLGIDPNWLMAIMKFESAGTFSPSKKNSIGCIGLIQFCPDVAGGNYKTINGKRYYLSDLAKMTALEQLDIVYEYYKPFTGDIKNYIDTYFVTLFPLAIGKIDDWVIQGAGVSASAFYKSNPAFNIVKDGKVRVWEVKKVMLEQLPSEWLANGSFSLAIKAYKNYIGLGLLSILSGLTLYYYYGRNNTA